MGKGQTQLGQTFHHAPENERANRGSGFKGHGHQPSSQYFLADFSRRACPKGGQKLPCPGLGRPLKSEVAQAHRDSNR